MERRKQRRAAQVMYIPPGRRAMNKISHPEMIKEEELEKLMSSASGLKIATTPYSQLDQREEEIEICSTESIDELVNSFAGLSMDNKQKIENFIEKMKEIVQNIDGQCKNEAVEKIAVTIIKEGSNLLDACPSDLDSLMNLVRDKILEKKVPPNTKRYLFNIIEWRARSFRLV